VTCALLAEAGIRGFSAPLEGAEGFYRLFAGGHYEPSALLEGLGHRFWIEQLSFKKWPCCRGTHAYIEAIQALRKRRQFRRHEVMLVQASGGDAQRMLCEPADSKRQPRTLIDARFSIPFAIACALAHDEVTLASFTAQTLHDPQLLALAARVQFSYRPDWPEDGTAAGAVSLQLADGSRESLRVAHAVGHPGNPLSDQELIDKFVLGATLAAPQRKPADVRAYARSLLELHHSKDVAAEFSWLGVDAGAPML
jgi:2-methylcitrate dehydratase PrpD